MTLTSPSSPAVRGRRLFLAGQGVSFFGSEITTFCIPLIGVVTLHAGPQEMGLLTAAGLLPHALAPFFAGPLVDALPKRRMLVGADLMRALLLAAIPLAAAAGMLTIPLLVGIAFALGMFSVLFDVAFFAFVPVFIPSQELVAFNGRLESLRSASQTLGPGAAGALVGALSAPVVVLVDIVSFAFSAATVRSLKVSEPRLHRDEGGVRTYLASVRSGFSLVWNDPALRLLGLGSGAYNFGAGASVTVLALFMLNSVGLTPLQFGLAMAVGCCGGVIAGSVAERLGDRLGVRAMLCIGIFVAALCNTVLGLAPRDVVVAGVMLALAFFLGSIGTTMYVVTNASMRQALVPAEVRGSVYATMRLLNRVTMPLGALGAGWFATETDVRLSILVAGLTQVFVAVCFFLCRFRLPERI